MAEPSDRSEPSEGRAVARWVLDRLYGVSWAVLCIVWLLLGLWALRLGEAVSALWVLTSALHLLLLPAWPILGLAALRRSRGLAVAASVTILAQVAILWPLLPWDGGGAGPGRRLSIASINLFVDNPDLDAAGHEIATLRPSILVVQEFTPEAQAAFRRTGVTDHFAYRIEHPIDGTTGEAVYSRYPLRELARTGAIPDVLSAVATLPDGRQLHVLDVHSFPPQRDDPGLWERELHQLDHTLDATAAPWVSIGDYNATFDHRVFRDLLHHGRHDAHLMTGRGHAVTWPADMAIPPLVLIDHALLAPGVGAVATHERTIAGSDHRMILVELTA